MFTPEQERLLLQIQKLARLALAKQMRALGLAQERNIDKELEEILEKLKPWLEDHPGEPG